MDILFITRKWPPAVGGMETYCVELARRLGATARLSLHALPGRADGSPPAAPALVGFGLRVAWRLLTSPGKFDVAHGGDVSLWPLIWLAGVRRPTARLFLSAHGTDVSLGARRGPAPFAYRAYLRLGARLLPEAVLLANSAPTAELAKRFGFRRVRVVHLAAAPVAAAPADLAEPYIAFVGRLTSSKGCGWFVRDVLPKLPPEIRLKVAGTVIDAAERDALLSERVDYLGPLFGEALAALRRNAIAVIVPNLLGGPQSFEGFGLAATEAAAAGGVVIAARAHGLSDAVRDEVTGFLEQPGDAERWAARIMDIRSWTPASREAFVAEAMRVSAEYYCWDRVARETLAAYCLDAAGDEESRLEQGADHR